MSISKNLGVFFITTFLFSWVSWLPIILYNLNTIESPAGAILFMLGGFGPSIIGFIAIFLTAKKEERKELWLRLVDVRRIGLKTLIVALIFYPLTFVIALGINLVLGGSLPQSDQLTGMLANPVVFIVSGFIILLLGPLSEEVGWRGYALDKMQTNFSPIQSSLIIGFVWAFWHLPLFFMPSTLHGSEGFLSFFTVGYFLTVIAYSIIFTWLYNQTQRSILIAVLAHFSINFVIGTLSPFDGLIFILTTILLLVFGLVIWAKDKNLALKSKT
jgi:uncharacterized protein